MSMSDKRGWLYVMKNKDMPEQRYKIGMTKRDPLKRARELSTSYENDMEVLLSIEVSDRFKAEKKVFELLDEHKPNKKELVDVYNFDMLVNIFSYIKTMYPLNKEDGIKIKVTYPKGQ